MGGYNRKMWFKIYIGWLTKVEEKSREGFCIKVTSKGRSARCVEVKINERVLWLEHKLKGV